MQPKPSDEAVEELFRRAWNASVAKAPMQHSQRTAACPSLPRFAEALRTGWQADERAHIANCSYCQSTWKSAQRIAAEPDEADVVPAAYMVRAALQVREYGVRADFSMAAGASCSSNIGETMEFPLEDGWLLKLSPKPANPELMTLCLDGHRLTGIVEVVVDGQPLTLAKPFDEYGYATVARRDVERLLKREAQPTLRITKST